MKQKILNSLETINNLYTKETVDIEKFINLIEYDEANNRAVIILNPLGDNPEKNKLIQREVIKKCKIDLKISGVKVSYAQVETETDEKTASFSEKTRVIAIMSGKGGVGKSQVTVNIAKALARSGKKVGIIDSDIYGYSIPKILNLYQEPDVVDKKIIPLKTKEGIEIISSQYFIENNENKAIVWRGPMLLKMMNHFVFDVNWSHDLDYLLIDTPPGTGDVLLNLSQLFDEIESIIVTTSNSDASHVALRTGNVAYDLNFDVIGVIENMSYYSVDNEKHYIFGSGGGEKTAKELNVPLLFQIPITQDEKIITEQYDSLITKF